MEGHLVMSEKERRRMRKFEDVLAGRVSLKAAAEALGLSYRQAQRSFARYRQTGAAGLVHQSRGRVSNRRTPEAFRTAVLACYRESLEGYGPVLAAEELAKQGLVVHPETLRRWLMSQGLWAKKRKRPRHRTRRPRRTRFGELLQIDGSTHQWFDGDEGYYCLMNVVDDATGTTMALMDYGETTEVAMRLLEMWCARYGVPQAIYADKKTVFFTQRAPTPDEQRAGEQPRTAFGQACHKLGIQLIRAHSAQAKGRVERSHGVYQDRFVKHLARLGITSIARANQELTGGFCDALNAQFAKAPADPIDAHSPVEPGLDLAQVFCWEQTRCLTNDWCIRHEKSWYHIAKTNRPLPQPNDSITVRTLLDGSVHLLWKNHPLNFEHLSQPPAQNQPKLKPKAIKAKANSKPGPDHPWRRFRYGRKQKDTA